MNIHVIEESQQMLLRLNFEIVGLQFERTESGILQETISSKVTMKDRNVSGVKMVNPFEFTGAPTI